MYVPIFVRAVSRRTIDVTYSDACVDTHLKVFYISTVTTIIEYVSI